MFIGGVAPMNIRDYVHWLHVIDECTEIWGHDHGSQRSRVPYMCRLNRLSQDIFIG
jgi:hypothetical protein